VESVAREVLASIDRRDWDALKSLLHPYLHWTGKDGRTLRGRNNVLARLARQAPTGPPRSIEIRDGQVYRWTESGY
jgi:hypothetical protein